MVVVMVMVTVMVMVRVCSECTSFAPKMQAAVCLHRCVCDGVDSVMVMVMVTDSDGDGDGLLHVYIFHPQNADRS
jgi:hypothetical protein